MLQLLGTVFNWRKLLITALLVAAAGSALIALLLPEYYQSTTVFYAVSPDQSTPELLFGEGMIAPELYGNEDDIDRLMTISESDLLVDYLVDSFDLYTYYDIDADSPKGKHYVRRHFRGLYDVMKTKRDAIQLSVEDKNPEQAAQMTRAAREKINAMVIDLGKKAQSRTIQTYEEGIRAKEAKLATLSDTLERLRNNYGIFNTESQSEGITGKLAAIESKLVEAQAKREAFAQKARYRDSVSIYEVRIAGLETQLTEINKKLQSFNKGVSRVLFFTRQYQEANKALSADQEKLKQYRTVYGSDTPGILLVEEAAVPIIKSRPFRALIVVGSVFITLLFALIGIFLFEAFRDQDWQQIFQER
ncbi:MAG: hypothetical protein AAGJ82_10585 [Bacteroidota bacterium]